MTTIIDHTTSMPLGSYIVSTGDAIDYGEANLTATVDNGSAIVSGGNNAILSDFNFSTLDNNGVIYSLFTGVSFDPDWHGGAITNEADGFIGGLVVGVYAANFGTVVTNHGTIVGYQGTGVFFGQDLTTTVGRFETLSNDGNVHGHDNGVYISGDAITTITNSGMIRGDVDDGIACAPVNNLTFTQTITNEAAGTIKGGAHAIFFDASGQLDLTNFGKIIGAITSTVADGFDRIVNDGTISGPVHLGPGNDLFNGTLGVSGAIFGEAGNDRLIGGRHADVLSGGPGNDRLTGRGGADHFLFDAALSAATNVDRITDFAPGVDKVLLSKSIFTHLGAHGMLTAAQFHVGAAAAHPGDRIIYDQAAGALYYDADGTGGVAKIEFAKVVAGLDLHNTDFLVVA